MAIFCICCELTEDTHKSDAYNAARHRASLPAIGNVIAELGPCLLVAQSTWLVETELAIDAVIEKFHLYIFSPHELILVFAVGKGAEWRTHSGTSGDEAVDWLCEHLLK
jgi:hypothetical protein